MDAQNTPPHSALDAGGRFALHAVAIVVGLLLMVLGLTFGVTIVGLPLALPAGLAGLLMFLWGLSPSYRAWRTQG
jgi:hypothetical protein